MSKRKRKRESAALYEHLLRVANQAKSEHQNSKTLDAKTPNTANELRMMKKFRFQLLHRWISTHIEVCKTADVGGGKGLLTYLLRQDGWDVTTIDPESQPLPSKYKDISSNKQTRIAVDISVPRINQPFDPAMAEDFDLLIGMHAHGCNIKIIDSMMRPNGQFILLPCCIIDEPLLPPKGMHWLTCVLHYALEQAFDVTPFQLNFRGQNIGFYGRWGGVGE